MNKIILAVASATVALSASFSHAQSTPSSAYIGLTGGVSHWNADCANGFCKSKNPGSYRLFGGYNIDEHVAVELSYGYLGKLSGTGLISNVYFSDDLDAKSVDVVGVYKFGSPGSALTPFVKGGLSFTKAHYSLAVSNGAMSAAGSDSKNAVGVVLGAGATYQVAPNFALRAELTTQQLDAGVAGKGNVTSFGLGGQFQF